MPSKKVIIIANTCQWASWPQKIAAIKAFYAPLVNLEIDIKYTDFQNIPTTSYPGIVTEFGPTGTHDVQGTDLEIDQTWFNANIGSLIAGYDIAVCQAANVSVTGLPLGIKFENLNGTWCAETFVTDENFTYTLPTIPPATAGVNLGNEAEIIIEHEISHALYSITGQTDNTHLYFYANQFSRVLTDISFPNQSALTNLYQKLIADLQSELGLLKAQQATADTMPSAEQEGAAAPSNAPTATQTTSTASEAATGPSVTALATFIQQYEGWCGPGQSINGVSYPNGTISYQCNNPANAKWDGQANAKARTFTINGVEEIFADFTTYADGWQYMLDALTTVINGTSSVYNEAATKLGLGNSSELTLNQFFGIRDNTADGNNPDAYAAAAGNHFNVDPATFRMQQFTV